MVESVDTAVGMIVDALEANRMMEETLVIVTSDNGGLNGPTNNKPLRQGKGYAYEGGLRVPAIVSWRGTLPESIVSDQPITSVDYLPTICEATDTLIKDDSDIDGESLWSHLQSGGEKKLERDTLFWHFPHYRHAPGPFSAIRDGDWKLIRWYEGRTELYNLADDVGEQKDLFSAMPEKAIELNGKLTDELKRTGGKLPRQNPDFATK